MLVHIGQPEIAELVHNAWLKTIEEGIHTYDIFQENISKEKVGTKEFAQAVVARLGQKPNTLKSASYSKEPQQARSQTVKERARSKKELVGVDVFLDWNDRNAKAFGERLEKYNGNGLALKLLGNRGVNVYPNGFSETFCTDHWRARYMGENGQAVSHQQLIDLLERIGKDGLDFIKTENLYTFDGVKGYVSEGE